MAQIANIAADPGTVSGAVTGAAGLSGGGSVLEMIGSLMLVLVVIFALAFVARRLQGAHFSRSTALRLHSGIQVGAKERVVIVDAGGQQFLVGVAPGSVRLLHKFDAPVDTGAVDVDESGPVEPGFAERLRQALGGQRA